MLTTLDPTLSNLPSSTNDDVVHWFDEAEYPWAYCGAFIGNSADDDDLINCPLCLDIEEQEFGTRNECPI